MVAPRMQSKQPSLPKNVRRSLRKIDERIAQITTERAPIGVTEVRSRTAGQFVELAK